MRFAASAALLMLASCGGAGDTQEGNRFDVPQPSGPPVAQQADAVPSTAPSEPGPQWESVASPEGTALRLIDGNGKLLLSIGCAGKPPRLVATAPGFFAIGSEDRFSLGIGAEPVTLVADPGRQGQSGVTAQAPPPDGFGGLLEDAREVSAVYGTQQVGPVAAPPEALKEALAKSCKD